MIIFFIKMGFTNGSNHKPVTQVLLFSCIVLFGMLHNNAFAQFMIEPESVVQAEGLEAVFECLVTGAFSHGWFVNGVEQSEFPTNITVTGSTSANPSILTIPASSQFNNSVVQCVGFSVSGGVFSRNVTLIFEQVAIDVVNGAEKITISVTNNFTADLTYQLDVNKTAEQSSETFYFVFTLNKQFNFSLTNYSACDIFSFTVTPILMETKGRSNEPPVMGFFTAATGDVVIPLIDQNEDLKKKTVTLIDMVPDCSVQKFVTYSVNTSSDMLAEPITGNITDSQVIFTLPTDIRTNITVTLTSTLGVQLIFRMTLIKTFDVQDLLVWGVPGGINVNIVYMEGTLSAGALVLLLSGGVLDSSLEVFVVPRSNSNSFLIPVPSGEYKVIVFDLESESILRLPVSIAADSEDIVVTSDVEATTSPPPNKETITVTVLSNQDVQVTCPQPLNCLVLVQSLASLDVLHVRFIESFITTAIFSLDTVSNDNYMVVYSWDREQSIFDGRVSLITSLNPPTVVPTIAESPTHPGTVSQSPLPIEAIAGISFVVFLLLCVCVGTTIIVLLKIKKQKNKGEVPESERRVDWSSTLAGIEQPNEAYGINDMLKKNIAYEQTKTRTQRQRMDHSPVLTLTEGGEYENIQSVHQYEEVLPR